MENLGSMELSGLLRLFLGSVACAVIILLSTIAYIFITRRGGGEKIRARSGSGRSGREAPTSSYPRGASQTAAAATSGDEAPSVDVSARLAGTGRDAWLEEAVRLPGNRSPSYHAREVLRVVSEPGTGQAWAEVAGTRYRNLNDIRDRAVGERVLETITHVLRFSDGVVASDEGVVTLNLPPCDTVKVPNPLGVLSEEPHPHEMMRLMSNPDQDHFCVHIADQCYCRLAEVSDAATGRHILEAITRLLQFSNGMLATDEGVGTVAFPSLAADAHAPLPASVRPNSHPPPSADRLPTSAAKDRDPEPSAPSPSSAAPVSEQERFLRQLRSQARSEIQAPIERPSLMSSIRRMRKGPSAEPLPALNLADEINQVFQSKLTAADLTTTDAAVEENPDGGVRIRIGAAYYNSPDEVPDPRLRDMLKRSIAEWEQS